MTVPVIHGYPRADGRKGIRNTVLVAYLVECAHFVASKVVAGFPDDDVQLIGFRGVFPMNTPRK